MLHEVPRSDRPPHDRRHRTQRFRTKSFCHCLGTVDPFRDCRKDVNCFIHHLLKST